MNSYYLAGVLAMSLGVNAYQVYKIDKFGSYSNILDQKDRMIQDGYNELLISHINSLRNDQYDSAKSQGKIEGILSTVNNIKPEDNEISSIWHSGYYRGMDQVDYVRTMAYEDGYHKACDDMNCPINAKTEKINLNGKKTAPTTSNLEPSQTSNPLPESKNSGKPIIDFKQLPEKK
jgi:hypothetical protein